MAATLRAENFNQVNIEEQAFLAADVADGATTFTLQSAQNVAIDDFVVFGNPTNENTEIRRITGLAGLVATVSALTFDHQEGERILVLRGDQIRFYRAANVDGSIPDDDDFSSLATVSIDPDQLYTEYTDSGGGSGYWYKYVYRNSVSTTETDIAQAVAVRGGDYGHYCTIDDIRREAGLMDVPEVTDQEIDQKRGAAESRVNGILASLYALPLDEPYPAILPEIVIKLAAGWVLQRHYGPLSPETDSEGTKKVKEAERLLKEISSRTLVLLDATGISLLVDTAGISGWPDSTTAEALSEDGGGERIFRIGKEF